MQRPSVRVLAKYFLHGIGFTALLAIAALSYSFFIALLAFVGIYIGIIIGFAILAGIVGVANTYVTRFLWFRIEASLMKYIYQGVLLIILLVVVYVPLEYIYAQSTHTKSLPPLLSLIILLLADSFINGFLAKRVASIWQLPDPGALSIFRPTSTPTSAQPLEAKKSAQTEIIPPGLASPEKLQSEEAKLDLLLKHRARGDLLNPEALDHLIETQKRTVEALRQALTSSKS